MPIDYNKNFKYGKRLNKDLGEFVEQKEEKEKAKGKEPQEKKV